VHFFFKFLKCFPSVKSQFGEKIQNYPGMQTMLQHLIIQFCFYYYLSSGHLQEHKNRRKHFALYKWLQLLKRGGRLQEVPNIVLWFGNSWYFRKLVTEERCSLMRGGPNQRFLAFADPFEIDLHVHVDHMNLYYFVHYSEQLFSLQTLHGKIDD